MNNTTEKTRHGGPWAVSIRQLTGAILGILTILGSVNSVVIVNGESQAQLSKSVKIMRQLDCEDFVKIVGIQLEEIPIRLSFNEIEAFELASLPSEIYSHISEAQMVQLISTLGLVGLLNCIAGFPRRCKKVFERFNDALLQPHPDFYSVLDIRIFKYLCPWTTIISGPITQDQFFSLIHYSPVGVDDMTKLAHFDALNHSLTLLQRNDLDYKEVALAIGSNADALQEVKSVLPSVTKDRLSLLVLGYRAFVSSQK